MPALIMELSKYGFLVLMAVYMGLTFVALRKKDDDFRNRLGFNTVGSS